jgi:transcriptional regulator with XRE-family HTH domain
LRGVLVPRLRSVRRRRALSQEELADKAGVARTTVWKAEADHEVRPVTVRKLARALGVQPADLMAPE